MYKALDESVSTSEKLAAISDFAFRVWACGLARADIMGRIDAKLRQFRALVVPLVACDDAKVEAAVQELEACGLLHLYAVAGHRYGIYHDHDAYNVGLRNLVNQRSKCPDPPIGLCRCIRTPSLTLSSTKGEEKIGEERRGTVQRPSDGRATAVNSPLFVAFRNRNVLGTDSQLREITQSIIARYHGDESKACEASVFLKIDGLDVYAAAKLFKPNNGQLARSPSSADKSKAQLACHKCQGTGMQSRRITHPITKEQCDEAFPCDHAQVPAL